MTNHIKEIGNVSIPDFIRTLVNTGNSEQFWKLIGKWKNDFVIVDSYRQASGSMEGMNEKLKSVIERKGIRWFEEGQLMYAAKAYNLLLTADAECVRTTGHHFKDYVLCNTSTEKAEYMMLFLEAFEEYMKERFTGPARQDADGGEEKVQE